MAGKGVIAAAWSVVATLVMSQSAAAALFQSQDPQQLVLTMPDSTGLYYRIKTPPASENYRGIQLSTKRFASADGAFRIDCAVATIGINSVACAVTIDRSKSVDSVTHFEDGVVAKSIVFKLTANGDVKNLLTNFIYDRGAVYTSESLTVSDQRGNQVSVPRFRIDCPPDWVFDVVSCNGHVVLH